MEASKAKRLVWTVGTLAVLITGVVWMVVNFSFSTFLFGVIFGATMLLIYNWHAGGDLAPWGRKEEVWSSAPSWSPGSSGGGLRTVLQRRRWLVPVVLVVVIVVAAALLLFGFGHGEPDRFPVKPPHQSG